MSLEYLEGYYEMKAAKIIAFTMQIFTNCS